MASSASVWPRSARSPCTPWPSGPTATPITWGQQTEGQLGRPTNVVANNKPDKIARLPLQYGHWPQPDTNIPWLSLLTAPLQLGQQERRTTRVGLHNPHPQARKDRFARRHDLDEYLCRRTVCGGHRVQRQPLHLGKQQLGPARTQHPRNPLIPTRQGRSTRRRHLNTGLWGV